MLSLRRGFWGHGLAVDAAAQARGTAVSQGVELPQLVPQKVPQGRAADGAAEVGQQQVPAGARGRGEVEGVVRGVALCFHDGRQPGLLLKAQNRTVKKKITIKDKCCKSTPLYGSYTTVVIKYKHRQRPRTPSVFASCSKFKMPLTILKYYTINPAYKKPIYISEVLLSVNRGLIKALIRHTWGHFNHNDSSSALRLSRGRKHGTLGVCVRKK